MKYCPKCNAPVFRTGNEWKCLICGLNSQCSGFYDARFDTWVPLGAPLRRMVHRDTGKFLPGPREGVRV